MSKTFLGPLAAPSSKPPHKSQKVIFGETCWGHLSGVLETNIRTFLGNWNGTGAIQNSGDNEELALEGSEYMISEVVETGARTVKLLQNAYQSADSVGLQYRTANSYASCLKAAWVDYVASFLSSGYVQVRVESTL